MLLMTSVFCGTVGRGVGVGVFVSDTEVGVGVFVSDTEVAIGDGEPEADGCDPPLLPPHPPSNNP